MLSGWPKWRGFVPQWSDSGMAQTTAALASPLELFVGQRYLMGLIALITDEKERSICSGELTEYYRT